MISPKLPYFFRVKRGIDHYVMCLINASLARLDLCLKSNQRGALRDTHKRFAGKYRRKPLVVCGNGPSLNEIDLRAFRRNYSCAVNFFFKHPQATELSPNFYFLIDSKLANGIWPIATIDNILKTLPETEVFLNARWYNMPSFKPYLAHPRIHWILPSLVPNRNMSTRNSLDRPVYGLNVVMCAISVVLAMGCDRIGIVGVDGDGLFRELLDQKSHFYAGEKDQSMSSFSTMVESLYLSTHGLDSWEGWIRNLNSKGVQVGNLSKGGIMDCMPRWLHSDLTGKE